MKFHAPTEAQCPTIRTHRSNTEVKIQKEVAGEIGARHENAHAKSFEMNPQHNIAGP